MVAPHMLHNMPMNKGVHALTNAGRRFIQGAHAVPSSVGLFRGPHLHTKNRVPMSHNGMSVFVEKFDFQKFILLILRQC